MITHYIKISIRSLLRKKGYSFLSIACLTLGLASCLVIMLFVADELSFDQYHAKKQRIYRLATKVQGADFDGIAKVNGPWGPAALSEIPEIESMTRFVFAGQTLMENGKLRFYEPNGAYCDSTVFEIFSFNLIDGDPATSLNEPNSIVLTKTLADKYFPRGNAVGGLLKIDGHREFKVTGILADVSSNSHFTVDYLLSMSSLEHPQKDSWTQWNQFYTYVLVRQKARPEVVASKIKEILNKNMDAESAARFTPFLQPLTSIHLHSHLHREVTANSSMTYVYIFASVGLLILSISCTNFINMMTARATVRAKEIGVRKVNGALKQQLFWQMMTEVLMICAFAAIIAQGLAALALPAINEIAGKNIAIDALMKEEMVLSLVAVTLMTALLAGSYPALYQSSLKPIKALKGTWNPSKGLGVRKTLVTVQFALSSALVIGSVVIIRQMNFLQEKPLGFAAEQVINIPIRDDVFRKNYEAIKNELLKNPAVLSVSLSGNLPGGSDWGIPTLPQGFSADNVPPIRIMAVDDDFIETYGLTLAAGRNFSNNIASDTVTYLINEECAKQLGWRDPLSKTISMPVVNRPPAPVVGVVKDFHFHSLREKIGPLVFIKPPVSWFSIYSIKIDASKTKDALKHIEDKWSQFDAAHPFDYSFFDSNYSGLYQQERRLSQVVTYFTGVGIFLACLGLYSLMSYTTEMRRKELSIRKVIGASATQLTLMLARQSLMLVIIGFITATPLATFFLNKWLESFAYHTDMSVWLFFGIGLGSALIGFLTVGYQSLKAATSDPVKWLRNE